MKFVSVMRTVFMFGMATMKFSLKQSILVLLDSDDILFRHKSKTKISKPIAEIWNGEKIL
ncbi:hypothetical protein T08_12546 [Trichinella sp. T8]|nr:hypothetical protein T08_12546 [Trichinella sp. T8]